MDLHEHLPTPDDVRFITFVSQEGRLMSVGPEQYPVILCLLPDCPLNTRYQRGQGAQGGDGDNPADGDAQSNIGQASNDQMADQTRRSKLPPGTMVYNEWGELVDAEEIRVNPAFKDLDARTLFRLVNLNWHYRYKRHLDNILAAQLEGDSPFDDGPLTLSGRLMSWELKTATNVTARLVTPEAAFKIAIYDGPPRVLDIGCDAGGWCMAVKKQHPDWILEGIDDISRWIEERGSVFKDFMDGEGPEVLHFGRIHMDQTAPEFTLRHYGMLTSHKTKPIPRNLYGFVHGRDIFARIENYKTFLDEVRQILQPDGVIEFSEIDPRPRTKPAGDSADDPNDHTSRPVTGFSRNIADRFKSPLDAELATDVPGWTARVEGRLTGALRPHDGIAAANLKGWVEGAGFWDVKEVIVQLVIGGESHRGDLMLSFILFQMRIEDNLKKLRTEFPISDHDRAAMGSGKYFLNLHIVTGRKPLQPRPGDLLLDGSRQGMDDPYADMSHYPLTRATHWERFSKFDMKGGLASNALNKFKAQGSGVGPNLRDRISSLRLHGMTIGGEDFNDGSMMGFSSGISSTGLTRHDAGFGIGGGAFSLGLARPPVFNPAGRASSQSVGPPIPWATRPNMEEYYAAKAGRQSSTESQSGPSKTIDTEPASSHFAVPPSGQADTTVVTSALSANTDNTFLNTSVSAATAGASSGLAALTITSAPTTVQSFEDGSVPVNAAVSDMASAGAISSSATIVTGTTSLATEATAPIASISYRAAIASIPTGIQAEQVLEAGPSSIIEPSTIEANVPVDPASAADIDATKHLKDDPASPNTTGTD